MDIYKDYICLVFQLHKPFIDVKYPYKNRNKQHLCCLFLFVK
ncbi:hypothetical protein HMPREF0663_10941 [Hoylesella oralis ATCC 33269]|uniref:Uncharacterized protein n=1 Tax=Hoylesella oralis ATCC 33269 TaxID=873533 RepID=E7RP40_9BACT|nr:hypothetical protein HMPREF0663_10941 [Hoylesella oralis ATCC 33269]